MQTQDFQIIPNSPTSDNSQVKSKHLVAEEIQEWVVSYVAQLLEVNPDEVDVTISFDRYGLDSSAAVGLTGDLGDWLGYDLDPTLLYDYPTIEGLVQHLVSGSN